jgi:hypothetical protein
MRPALGRSRPAASRIRLDLPLPLGPVTCKRRRPARAKVQRRTAAARRGAGSPRRTAAAASLDAVLERVDVVVGQAEMMADLVDQDMRDEMFERFLAVRPFVEDRPAEQESAPAGCRTARRFARSAECPRTGRSARTGRRSPSALERLLVGEVLDEQDDVAEAVRERLGQRSSVGGRSPRSPQPKVVSEAAHRRAIGAWRRSAASLPAWRRIPRWHPSSRCTSFPAVCGAVAEWSKALAWKVSIRQNRIEGSNPSRSAIRSEFEASR